MTTSVLPKGYYFAPMLIVLLLAAFLRIVGVHWGLPYQLHPDEPLHFVAAKHMAENGSLSGSYLEPFMNSYPPLYNRFLLLVRKLMIVFEPETPQVSLFLIGRLINVFVAVLTIVFAANLARILAGPRASILTALFLTVNPLFVEYSRYAIPDMPVTLLSIITIWMAVLSRLKSSQRLGFSSVIYWMFATFTKYNVVSLAVLPLYAIVRNDLGKRRRLILNIFLYSILVVSFVVLLITRYHALDFFFIPYSRTESILTRDSVLKLVSFHQNLQYIVSGMGDLLSVPLLIIGSFLFFVDRGLRGHVKCEGLLMIGLFIIVFFLIISLFEATTIYDFLPIIVLLSILWALGIDFIVRFVLSRVRRIHPLSSLALQGLIPVILLTQPATVTVRQGVYLSQKDTRAITADWFQQFGQEGAKIAVEYSGGEFQAEYGGNPGPRYFEALEVPSLFSLTEEEYRLQGIQYLVADNRAQKGYFSRPEDPEFFRRVILLADNPSENRPGPARKIFTWAPIQNPSKLNIGNLITFLGYDLSSSVSTAGDIIILSLYWQARVPLDTSYTVFTHLIGGDNRIWAQEDGIPVNGLKPATSWEVGEMIFDEYTLKLPADIPPGEYPIEIGLYVFETGDRVPVFEANNSIQDRILLGPIQVSSPS